MWYGKRTLWLVFLPLIEGDILGGGRVGNKCDVEAWARERALENGAKKREGSLVALGTHSILLTQGLETRKLERTKVLGDPLCMRGEVVQVID